MRILFAIFFLISSFSAFSQSDYNYTFYEWEYAISPKLTREVLTEPNLDRYSAIFSEKIDKSKAFSNRSSLDRNISEFVEKLETKTDNRVLSNEKGVLVFAIAEKESIGLRVFIYNHNLGSIDRDTSFIFFNDDLSSSPEMVFNWVKDHFNKPAYSKIYTKFVFNECYLRFKIDYYRKKYEDLKLNVGVRFADDSLGLSPLTGSIDLEKMINITDTFLNDPYFRRTNFQNALEVFKNKRRFQKNYPLLISVLSAINIYDIKYKLFLQGITSKEEFKKEIRSLVITIDTLLQDPALKHSYRTITKEAEKLQEFDFDIEKIYRDMNRNIQFIANCDEVQLQADSMLKDRDIPHAFSKYMQIILNENVNHMLLVFERDSLQCLTFKANAFQKIKEIQRIKYANYQKEYKICQDLSENECNERRRCYLKAQSKVGHISVFMEKNLEKSCFDTIEYEKILAGVMDGIRFLLDVEFGQYDAVGDLDRIYINNEVFGSNIISLAVIDSLKFNTSFNEINFRYGQYESIYEKELLKRLQNVIEGTLSSYGDYVEYFSFYYRGSSDATGFKNKKKGLELKKHEEINQDYRLIDVEVCEIDFWNESRPEGCFEFSKLASGKVFSEIDSGSSVEEIKGINSDYSKNLALAYLRARYRHDKLMDLLVTRIPKEKLYRKEEEDNCECNCLCKIEAVVNKNKGEEFRSVDMEIGIKLFSSEKAMQKANRMEAEVILDE